MTTDAAALSGTREPWSRRDVVAASSAYPPAWAEAWDRVGLVVGEPAAPVRRVLLAVDCVPETVAEASRSAPT